MASYVDLYLIPLSKKNFNSYKKLAQGFGKIIRDYGVKEYREFSIDDSDAKGGTPYSKIVKLKKGETFIDLGSGDGKMLRQAAKQGAKAIGYEINPVIWLISIILCFPERKNISIKMKNYFHEDLSSADAIATFSHSRFMQKLENKLNKESDNQRFASVAYPLPGKKSIKEKDGVFLYQF